MHHKSMTNQGAFKEIGTTTYKLNLGNPGQLLPKAENIKKKNNSLANRPDFDLAEQKGSAQPDKELPTCMGAENVLGSSS